MAASAVSTKTVGLYQAPRPSRARRLYKEVILMVEVAKVVRHHDVRLNLRRMSDAELDSFLSNVSAHIRDLTRMRDVVQSERDRRSVPSNVA